MADRPDHDLADRLTDLADGGTAASTHSPECWRYHEHCAYLAAAARLRQLTERLGDSWYTDIGQRLDDVTAERDELRRQLDTLRNALLDAIGDPDELRRVAVSVARDRKVTSAEAERRIGLLTRIAAAVGDPEPTNPDEPHPDADFIEVDYWCHFDDKGRAVRVHDASTVHMDGCTRMYVRAVGDPEEGR